MATQRVTPPQIPGPELELRRKPEQPGRRSFLTAVLGAGAGIFTVLCALPLVRYIAYPLFAAGPAANWIDLGALNDFTSKEPIRKLVNIEHLDGWQKTVSQEAVYVTRDSSGSICALSAVCPHLGCSIAWQPAITTFVCPCHGGRFAPDGSRLSGPPPRNMTALPVNIADGRLAIRYPTRDA
jgi:Rieske Fe-S protein